MRREEHEEDPTEALTRRTGNCNHEHVYVEHCFDEETTGPLPLLFLQHKIF